MPTTQNFTSAYLLTAAPTDGASFNLTFSGGGSSAPRFNVGLTDSATSDANTNILGNIANDAITTTGFNNNNAVYWGTASVVSGGVTYNGIIIFDSNGGGKYWFMSGASSLSSISSSTAAESTAGTNIWTISGTAAPAPVITGVIDNTAPQTGTIASGGSTNDTTPTFSGTGGAGSIITIKDGSTTLGTAAVGSNGTWSYTTPALASGVAHTISVTETSTTGVVSNALTYTFTVDTTAPNAPSIGGVADNAGAVTGTLTNGATTDDTTPTLTLNLAGTGAVAGNTVTLLSNGVSVGTVTLTAAHINAGSVSISPSAALSGDGLKALTTTITDAAGNVSPASAALNITLDTTAPTKPTVGSASDDQGALTGPLVNGATTDDTTPTLTVTLTGTGAVAGNTVTLLSNGVPVGTVTLTTAHINAGSVSISPSAALSGDGAKALTTTITDAAGNVSPASTALNITLDTTAPTTTTTIGLVADTGVAGDGISANPALTGTSSSGAAGETITIRDGATVLGTATTGTGGTWSFANGAAADGAHSYTAAVTDAAGNTGSFAATSPASVTVDKTAPTTTTSIGLAQDTGAAGDGTTSDPTLTGTGPANATIVVKEGATVLGTATADASGHWSFTPGGLAQGAHSFTAHVADAAGNLGTGTTLGGVTLDTVAPTETTTIALAVDTGAPGDGLSSNPALTGTVSSGLAGVTVEIRDGGTVIGTATTGTGGTWSFANGAAPDGAHSYSAAVIDTAGNAGPAQATSPAATSVDTQGDGDVVVTLGDATADADGASVTLGVTGLDAGSKVSIQFTGSLGGSVTLDFTANGNHAADVSGLQGDVTATYLVTDAAGNLSDGPDSTLAGDPVCFYPGTLVRTPAGEVAVEALRIGDLVLTSEGQAMPVRWMGRQTVSTRFADPVRVLPIRIAAGALGEALPVRDLLVSPDHAILLDGVLVQAGALVNGRSITRESAVPQVFTYYHVELADHSLILAEGVPAETFVDNVERLAFDNWAEHEALYGHEAPVAELGLPRAKSHRQVAAATRQRLAARAEELLGSAAAAA